MKTHNHLQDREYALAQAMKDIAAELRLVDPADYVGYVRMEQYSNLEDIINSSSELLFLPGTLTFGWGADARLSWGERPRIYLDMEFRFEAVTVFFSLGLSGDSEFVAIRMITFESPDSDPLVNTTRLVSALNAARCVSQRS
ncbi:MAG: hypothetical protein JWN07_2239 [Hyphomicrobiales bacterium]|nr:hypothetical protein [Hyphomicrobiales bacterium]